MVPKVTNTTGVDVFLAATQDVVLAGASIDVDAQIAESLKAQGWKVAGEPRKTQEVKNEDTAEAEVN